jgi:hypothetical protein
MKKIIRVYYLRSFYIITLLFSILLLTLHFVFESIGKYSVSFTQLSPALAVVFISLILKDKTIINDIKNHFRVNKTVVKWMIPAIVIPSICIVVSSLIMTYYKIDYVPWQGDMLFYVLNFVAILIGSAAEESPPPTTDTNSGSHKALATISLPWANCSFSKTPIGPFQKAVLAPFINRA